MERDRITAAQAFEVLKRASQHMNLKLREIAETLVRSGETSLRRRSAGRRGPEADRDAREQATSPRLNPGRRGSVLTAHPRMRESLSTLTTSREDN